MDAKKLLTDALETRWKDYRAKRKICRDEFSEEAVHDLRVAARRLLAALDMLRAVMPHARIQKLRRDLKDKMGELNDLRDTQVLLADISESLQEQPELKFFQKILLREEKKQLRAARKYIKTIKFGDSARRMKKILAMLAELPAENLDAQLLQIIDAKYASALEQYRLVNSSLSPVHFLRLAFKKFRYTLEIAQPLLEKFPEGLLEALHEYQAQMGDIQDMDVALQRMEDLKDLHPDLETARVFYQRRRAEALTRFMESRHTLLNFWRAAPDQKFSQENRS